MPVWAGFLILPLFSIPLDFQNIITNSELTLFSASALFSSFYVVNKKSTFLTIVKSRLLKTNYKEDSFPESRFFNSAIVILIVFAVILFSVASIARIPDNQLNLNLGLLTGAAVILFLATVIFSVWVTYFENIWANNFDPQGISNQQVNDLTKEGKRLRGRRK